MHEFDSKNEFVFWGLFLRFSDQHLVTTGGWVAVRPPTARFDTRGTTRDSFPNSLTLIYVNKLLQVQKGVQNKVFPDLMGVSL